MRTYFCKLNIIASSIYVLPAAGLGLAVCREGQTFLLAASAIPGIFLAKYCLEHLPFRPWLCLSASLWLLAFALIFSGGAPVFTYAGTVFLGLFSAGNFFILPSLISLEESPGAHRLSAAVSLTFIFLLPYAYMLTYYPFAAGAVSLAAMTAAAFAAGEKPRLFTVCFAESAGKKRRSRSESSRIYIFIFFFLAVFCAGITRSFGSAGDYPQIVTDAGIGAGLFAGAALTGFSASRQGIYGSGVFFIFITELAAMCSGLYSGDIFAVFCGEFAFGAVFSSAFVLAPSLTYYMLGSVGYGRGLLFALVPIPAGLLASAPAVITGLPNNAVIPAAVFVLFLLIIDFFIIFSAWKHRFVLLK